MEIKIGKHILVRDEMGGMDPYVEYNGETMRFSEKIARLENERFEKWKKENYASKS